jgi:putative DNA primase/helicase
MSAPTIAVARGRADDLGAIVSQETRTLAELADLFQQAHAVPPGFSFAELCAERQALTGAQAAHDAAKGAGATREQLKRLHDPVRAVKARITRWKQTAWISFGTYSDAKRRRETIQTCSAFVGDADHGARLPKLLEDLDRLGCAYVVHTSTSHGCEGIERYRVVVPLAQPLSAPLAQYPPLWEFMQKALDGVLDPRAKDPTRASFMPRIPTGAQGHQVICVDNRPWFDVTSLPADCQVAEVPASQAPQTTISAEQEADLRAALTHPALLEALGDNLEWTRLGYALLSLGPKGFELFRWASEQAPNYEPNAPERWWADHGNYVPQSDYRSIYKRASELGWSNPRVAATSTAGTFPLIPPDGAPAPVALQRTAGGRIIPNASNALTVLEQQTVVRLTYDEFDERTYVKWPEDPAPRPLTDEDTTRIRIALQRSKLETLSAESTHAAIQLIAHRNPTNRLVDWLSGLKWDSTRRLSLLMQRGFGTPPTRYYIRAGRNLALSMVARPLSPGCQVDEAIVLEGPQGSGKSSAFRIIGGEYFKELTADPRTKDFEQQLHGVWLGEFAELSTLPRAEASRTKQFVTCRVDHYRPPFGREVRDYPRRTVLCGSTNEAEWIHDTTGGRRFIPINVGRIDLEWLKANREQLFAEAVMLYKQKQRRKWWIYPKEETLAQQEARTEEDPWTVKVHAYLQGRAELPDTTGLLTHVLDVPTGRQMKGQQTRLGQILRKLGCEQLARCRRDGKRVRPWKVPDELARAPMLIPPPLTFPTPVQLAPAMQPLPPASNGDLA